MTTTASEIICYCPIPSRHREMAAVRTDTRLRGPDGEWVVYGYDWGKPSEDITLKLARPGGLLTKKIIADVLEYGGWEVLV